MAEILGFPDTYENLARRTKEISIGETKLSLGELLIQTPASVYQLIQSDYSRPQDIIVINPERLKELIIDYTIFHLSKAKISLENSGVIFGVQYITDLLFKLFLFNEEEIKLIVQHPYYFYWMKSGYTKRAGDASIYSYMFRDPPPPMKRENYIACAVSGYTLWSKDPQIPRIIGRILLEIGDMVRNDRFLKRGVIGLVK